MYQIRNDPKGLMTWKLGQPFGIHDLHTTIMQVLAHATVKEAFDLATGPIYVTDEEGYTWKVEVGIRLDSVTGDALKDLEEEEDGGS